MNSYHRVDRVFKDSKMWQVIMVACLVVGAESMSMSDTEHNTSSFMKEVSTFSGYLNSFLDMLYPLPDKHHNHKEVSTVQKKLLEDLSDPATTYAVWQAAMELAQEHTDSSSKTQPRRLIPDAIMFLVKAADATESGETAVATKLRNEAAINLHLAMKQMEQLLGLNRPAGDWQALADHGSMLWRGKNNEVAGRAAAMLDDIAGMYDDAGQRLLQIREERGIVGYRMQKLAELQKSIQETQQHRKLMGRAR
ncbi:hypothetical protein TGP89_305530 [Toxoplasma gondii p89]|uniref:Uncharacterized protein n=1 Tax=Toxoplasma gondii p89 TaxID=943119 RepID=A0A086J8K9_TOXGO|nr:hypothetical protein TGP89_305530 [Toxoplasma gondii p89]